MPYVFGNPISDSHTLGSCKPRMVTFSPQFFHRVEIAWYRCRNLRYILTASKVSKSLRLRLFQASVVSRTIQEESRNPTINVVMKAPDRRRSWLGHVLRMPEHRLVRQILSHCVRPTHFSQTYQI